MSSVAPLLRCGKSVSPSPPCLNQLESPPWGLPMTTRLLIVLCLALAMRIATTAQAPGSIVRLDPAFDAIVPAGATIETLKEGFGFINGILWVRNGNAGHLLVSDIPANVIHTWTPPNTMAVFLDRPD